MSETDSTEMDQARQRIAELEAQLATSQAAKNVLAGQVALLQNPAPAPPTVAAAPAPRAPRPSINPPTAFDGSRAKGKAFLRQAYLYIRSRPDDYPNDGMKILCVLSYMTTGSAATWAGQVTDKLIDSETKGTPAPYTSYVDFVNDFSTRFTTLNEREEACNALDVIKQATRSADDYNAEFNEHAPYTGHGDSTLVRLYKKGLTQALLHKIYAMEKVPETLENSTLR